MPTPTLTEIRAAGRRASARDHPDTIRAFYPFWDAQYRPLLLKSVEALPAEHFDFKPRPEMLTAHQIVLHVAEAERAWIHHVAEGGPYEEWVVPHSDPAQGWVTAHAARDHAELVALLETWHRSTQTWLDRPQAELSRVIAYKPRDLPERTMTLHWILDHLQEHEILHRTQLNLYLRLLGIEPPSL